MKHRRHHIKNKVLRLKNKKPILKRLIFWLVLLFFIIIFSLLYISLFSSTTRVNSIIITGNKSIPSEDIEDIVWGDVNKRIITFGNWSLISKSIFLTGSKLISDDILNKFPQIENVEVFKNFPQTIELQIKERIPVAVFCQADNRKCFYIDENGIIFKALDQIPENSSIIKQLTENRDVSTGERVVEKNVMDIISKIKKNLKDNFQIDIKEAMITTPFRLNIKTSENWQIYFNLDSETDLQISKLNLLLKDEITSNLRRTLQYIDLRFKDRAYYK